MREIVDYELDVDREGKRLEIDKRHEKEKMKRLERMRKGF